jgi:hypothetical protein
VIAWPAQAELEFWFALLLVAGSLWWLAKALGVPVTELLE